MKIKDFGEKIGGAKKDLWKIRGLCFSDLEGLSIVEKGKLVKRDNIWPKPAKQTFGIDETEDRFLAYWKKEIRRAVKPTCPYTSDEDVLELYTQNVSDFRDMVNAVSTTDEIAGFYIEAIGKYLVKLGPHIYDYSSETQSKNFLRGNILLRGNSAYNRQAMRNKMLQSGWGLTDEDAVRVKYKLFQIDGGQVQINNGHLVIVEGHTKRHYYPLNKSFVNNEDVPLALALGNWAVVNDSNRILTCCTTEEEAIAFQTACTKLALDDSRKHQEEKKERRRKWLPPQFENVKREGSELLYGRHVKGQDFLEDFNIRGGEFGNWTDDKHRQVSMDMAYEGFHDLASALNISYKDIGLQGLLHGSLAIAFGSRGSGNAVAHYENGAEVINITKLRGAGSLAHEWGHALDDLIGKKAGIGDFASENFFLENRSIPETFRTLMHRIIYDNDEAGNDRMSRYYSDSKKFGGMYAKDKYGYWDSRCELFARAFACFVKDNLKGKNDYLCGHAETARNEDVYAYPIGKDREDLNKCFRDLIEELKTMGLFHQPVEFSKFKPTSNPLTLTDPAIDYHLLFSEESNGQLSLF